MKTDVEVKRESQSPAYKEAFFKLSHCGRFGAIISGKDVLRWIASREDGIAFAREASVCERIISHADREKLMQLIARAPYLAMRENQVEFQVRESVKKLNESLEAYQGLRRYMFTLSEKVDADLAEQALAQRPYD